MSIGSISDVLTRISGIEQQLQSLQSGALLDSQLGIGAGSSASSTSSSSSSDASSSSDFADELAAAQDDSSATAADAADTAAADTAAADTAAADTAATDTAADSADTAATDTATADTAADGSDTAASTLLSALESGTLGSAMSTSSLLGGDTTSSLLGGDTTSSLLAGDTTSSLLGGDTIGSLLGTSTSGVALSSSASSQLTAGQQQFASTLSADTGLNPNVVSSWLLAEESGAAAQSRQAAGNNDWLNIGYTDSGTYGSSDAVWSDPTTAADATAAWLQGQDSIPGYGTASAGIQSILLTVGQTPAAQIQAIQSSGWSSSGYPSLDSLYQSVAGG